MKRRSEPAEPESEERGLSFQDLIGLGSHSARKSHYSVLEEKLAELETERNRYKWLFENALHGIFQADFNGTVRAANPAFATMCGYEESRQILDQPQLLETLFDNAPDYLSLQQKLLESGKAYRFLTTLKRRDGTRIHVSMNALLKSGEHGDLMEAFVQDISAYRHAQEELTRLNEDLEARVDRRTRELSALNEKLVREIGEREKMQMQLHLAKEVAEQANLSKDKYLAAASHDLLQPLNAARLLVSALRERVLAEQDAYLVERVHLALEGAEELLNDLLYISKLDQDAVQPLLEVFSIQQLLASLEGEFQPLAACSDLRLTVLPCRLSVRSDARLLGRILRNFISNALRYTQQGRVLVGCRRRGDRLSIQVWDTGEGVPDDRLQEIFHEFYQLNTRPRARKGVGLGLAIVDRLARMLNHLIEVRSWPGRGSMFSVEVVLSAAAPTYSGHRPALAVNNLNGACILVLDNDDNILISMEALLREWNCVVYLARDQAEAIDLCKASSLRPDVILADYHLDRGQTGTDAVLAMRQCAGSEIPAAIITADYSEESGQLFQELRLPLLNKPVKPARLRALLSHLLRDRQG
ncbi:PAS domain-containing hybrid sensor histidine kinase/response regulator [Sedimenticola sp.]|uniref:PAS domain-containing hybrid sensor histidine kinase/response regulator n=1 Tax=Sedimenticola sp. TaxID=1940285 RepID=UPI0025857AFC|nr:NahK/ErcS family hybrid sensor histidine kinase/response regulator [Sedimenticola sp.]MCW8905183.1 ATP-binding protein [Sedimenticola sp.]